MQLTQYGLAHPRLSKVIPLVREHAQAVATAWPGATVMARTGRRRRGIASVRSSWTDWAPSPALTPQRGGARTPDDLPHLLAQAYNAQDLEALLDLYETGAVLAVEGRAHVRHGALRDTLAGNIGLGVPMAIRGSHVLAAGDIALLLTDWVIAGVDRHGKLQSEAGRSADIARAGADGNWRYVVDNPPGAAWPDLPDKKAIQP